MKAVVFELLLLTFKVEKQFALRLRGTDFDQSPIVHQMLNDVGLDPKGGIIGKFYIFIRVKFFNRPDKPKISLLNQIEQILHPKTAVFHGDLNYQPQVGRDQILSCLFVVCVFDPSKESQLFGPGQQFVFAETDQVALECTDISSASVRTIGRLLGRLTELRRIGVGPVALRPASIRRYILIGFYQCFRQHADLLLK